MTHPLVPYLALAVSLLALLLAGLTYYRTEPRLHAEVERVTTGHRLYVVLYVRNSGRGGATVKTWGWETPSLQRLAVPNRGDRHGLAMSDSLPARVDPSGLARFMIDLDYLRDRAREAGVAPEDLRLWYAGPNGRRHYAAGRPRVN